MPSLMPSMVPSVMPSSQPSSMPSFIPIAMSSSQPRSTPFLICMINTNISSQGWLLFVLTLIKQSVIFFFFIQKKDHMCCYKWLAALMASANTHKHQRSCHYVNHRIYPTMCCHCRSSCQAELPTFFQPNWSQTSSTCVSCSYTSSTLINFLA